MINEPTIEDMRVCANALSNSCINNELHKIECFLGKMNFIKTRLIISGVISFTSIHDEELRLLAMSNDEPPNDLLHLPRVAGSGASPS